MQNYVALKIQKSAKHYTEAAMDEVIILKKIADGDPEDAKNVVKLLDKFKHTGPNGQHVCMVFEYLGDNLLTLIKCYNYKGLPIGMVKQIAYHVLVGLDYLHRQLSIIHTDLKPENILLCESIDPEKSLSEAPLLASTEEKQMVLSRNKGSNTSGLTRNQKKKLKRKAKRALVSGVENDKDQQENGQVEPNDDDSDNDEAGPCKEFQLSVDQVGETSEGQEAPYPDKARRKGLRSWFKRDLSSIDLRCKIVDLGNACWIHKHFTNDIQTRQYRCPEVLLGAKYSTSADMWSFACIVFELATGDFLFDPHSGDDFDRDEVCPPKIYCM